MEGAAETLKLISTYGVPLVISAIVLIAIWRGMGVLFKWLEAKSDTRRENADQKKAISEHEEKELIRMHVSPIVSQKLLALLHRAHAARAYVFEYHNGNHSFGGLPFLYMTNTYEETAIGVRSEQPRRQHLGQSMLTTFINALMENKYVVVDSAVHEGRYSEYVYGIMSEQSVTFKIAAKLLNSRGKMIGHVGLDYAERPDESALKEALKGICYSATELGALLSVDGEEK